MGGNDPRSVALAGDSEEEEESYDEQGFFDEFHLLGKHSLAIKCIGIPLFFLAGSLFLKVNEGWSFLTSFYVAMQIVTTVGYGDVTVSNDSSIVFMIFYVLLILIFIAGIVNDIGNYVANKESAVMREGLTEVTGGQGSWKRYHLMGLTVAFVFFVLFALFGMFFYANYEDCSCSYGVTQKNDYPTCVTTASGTDWNGDVHATANCAATGQSKSYLHAFYMSIITMTTVGYGDYFPVSKVGRGIAIVWMLLGVLASGNLVTAISSTVNALTKAKKKATKNSADMLSSLDTNGNGSIDRDEFLRYMIYKHDLVPQETMEHIDKVFASMASNTNGKVTIDTISEQMADDEE